jgi:hypothetical protein
VAPPARRLQRWIVGGRAHTRQGPAVSGKRASALEAREITPGLPRASQPTLTLEFHSYHRGNSQTGSSPLESQRNRNGRRHIEGEQLSCRSHIGLTRRLGSAPALGADHPTPTAPFPTLTSLCFQQFGEPAFRSAANPNATKRSDSGTILAQGARMRHATSEAAALPDAFWYRWVCEPLG